MNRFTSADLDKARNGHIGPLLRNWRAVRSISQLALALEAGVSTRHLSYVETGRAQPSREMVLRLADALQVPLRERNSLLLAAGYAPFYSETPLNTPEMAEAQRALEFILAQQEPYPAIVVDRRFDILMLNSATERFLALFPECKPPGAPNALRLIFHPEGLRPFIDDWEQVAGRLIQRVHREVAANPSDLPTRLLLDELLSYPGVPRGWQLAELDVSPGPLLSIGYRRTDYTLRFFSMITTFGTPQDLTLQGLRVESFFPADDTTRQKLAPS